jgi:DNA (cytosine-5)-methyltransferase 1
MAVPRKRTRRSLSPVSDSDDDGPMTPPPPLPTDSWEQLVLHVPPEHEFPEGPNVQIIGETDVPDSDRDDDVPVRVLTDFSIYDHSTLHLIPVARLIELSLNPRLSFSASGCVKAWIDKDDDDDDDDEDEDEDQDQEDAEKVCEEDDSAAEDGMQRLKLTPIKRFSFHDPKQCHRGLDRCAFHLLSSAPV